MPLVDIAKENLLDFESTLTDYTKRGETYPRNILYMGILVIIQFLKRVDQRIDDLEERIDEIHNDIDNLEEEMDDKVDKI